MSTQDYGSWTLIVLRSELRKRGAKLPGMNMPVENVTIRQLFALANLNASQHDYEFLAKFSPEDQFLKGYGITEINDREAQVIENATHE